MKNLFILILIASCAKAPVKTVKTEECLTVRNNILTARSISPITYDDDNCNVVKGMWEDYFYPQFQTQADSLEVTHLVPPENNEALAKDTGNLVVTDKKYSRKKGAKTIVQWLPPHKEYACKYIKDWQKIKKKYKIKITKEEKTKIKEMACR